MMITFIFMWNRTVVRRTIIIIIIIARRCDAVVHKRTKSVSQQAPTDIRESETTTKCTAPSELPFSSQNFNIQQARVRARLLKTQPGFYHRAMQAERKEETLFGVFLSLLLFIILLF